MLDAAATFFGEHGFEATTRAFADQLGVTQALLYRYFPSKSVLIDRVFAERMSGGWDPAWSDLLVDRRLSLAERLTQFYTAYQGRVTETGMRLYLRAALQETGNRPRRYSAPLTDTILQPIAGELRHLADLPPFDERPMVRGEREIAMMLHAAIVFLGIRKFVYRMPMPDDLSDVIGLYVRTFVEGAAIELKALHGPDAPQSLGVEQLDRRHAAARKKASARKETPNK